jgi:hypothetical protein
MDRVALGLLAALVAANALSLALLQRGGPLIGLTLYAVLLWRWERRDYWSAVVGGLAGLTVHVVEVATTGLSAYPDLMALNLVLPALLAPVAWLARRQAGLQDSSEQP